MRQVGDATTISPINDAQGLNPSSGALETSEPVASASLGEMIII